MQHTVAAVAAVDLGATSGRVIVARFDAGRIAMSTVHRFANDPVQSADGLHWDIDGLYRNVVDGLTIARRDEPALASVGIDSWAVDYALLRDGQMLRTPYHYRDDRTERGVARVHNVLGRRALFERNGLQFLPFNTLYQLAAEDDLSSADAMLLIPDLFGYWLTGAQQTELTNASTTGLVDVRTREYDDELISMLGLPRSLFTDLVLPGVPAGIAQLAVGAVQVVNVGSHDTASAVVGTPMQSRDAAYISCGTWGLVGLELDEPVVNDASFDANFTNEGGVDGRVRFLRNVMGLWLLSESIRSWESAGHDVGFASLLAAAAEIESEVAIFDVDDPRFMAPGDLPDRIRAYCGEHDLPFAPDPPVVVRMIVESLAAAFAKAIDQAANIAGRSVDVIHLVGGGSQNALLCQATADRSGRPVLAGPVEATALGNVVVQARAAGILSGELEELRAVIADSVEPVRYQPRG